MMSCRKLIAFKHVGRDVDPMKRGRQAMLGCAPAQRLLDPGAVVEVARSPEGADRPPRRFSDYLITVHRDRVPAGIEVYEDEKLLNEGGR
jgi:CRISPR-associated protein Csd2